MNELDTIRKVIEAISRGVEAAEAIGNFCEWLFNDPAEAARIAKSKALGTASGKAAYAAAKNAGRKR